MKYPFSYDVTLYNTWYCSSWTSGGMFAMKVAS